MLLALVANHGDRFFHHRGWWWFFGSVVPFVLLLALIGLAMWAILRMTSRGSTLLPAARPAGAVPPPDGALEEVRLRYARGEISREEFLQRSQDLGGIGTSAGEPGQPGAG
jgi:putative membrane protein